MNPKVDAFLTDGCGRCKYYATPDCKVNTWRDELETLRQILLRTPLTEDLKWGSPCYTYEGKNIVQMAALKHYCVLSFFKGALLKDPEGILEKPGKDSQSFRYIRFTDIKKIQLLKKNIESYIGEAIELEMSGAKITFKKTIEPAPEELLSLFKKDKQLADAFNRLTPGRQRGYIIFFSSAKQSATRLARIKKCREMILQGKDVNGR